MDAAEGTYTLAGARTLAPGMRRILNVAGTLVFLAGIQLFVLSTATDRFFAWTIGVPLTAAFLGVGYWASVALEWLAAREKTWVHGGWRSPLSSSSRRSQRSSRSCISTCST